MVFFALFFDSCAPTLPFYLFGLLSSIFLLLIWLKKMVQKHECSLWMWYYWCFSFFGWKRIFFRADKVVAEMIPASIRTHRFFPFFSHVHMQKLLWCDKNRFSLLWFCRFFSFALCANMEKEIMDSMTHKNTFIFWWEQETNIDIALCRQLGVRRYTWETMRQKWKKNWNPFDFIRFISEVIIFVQSERISLIKFFLDFFLFQIRLLIV